MVDSGIDAQRLLELASMEDELGVLSVFVDADPRLKASERPPWAIEIDNHLDSLRAQLGGERRETQRLREALSGLEPDVERLVDPASPGRGRALFAALAAGAVETEEFQLPVSTCVALERTAFILPLLGVVQRGAPLGLVTLARHQVRVIDWRAGRAEEVEAYAVEVATGEWTRLQGPAMANPARAQQTATQLDRYARRLEQDQIREIVALCEPVAAGARRRGWLDMVVSGDPRLAAAFVEALPDGVRETAVATERALNGIPAAKAAELVLPEIAARRDARAREVARHAVERALAGTGGCVGLEPTLAALAEGRVETLVLVDRTPASGTTSNGVGLILGAHAREGADAASPVSEPLRGERMLERALETGADVVLVADGDGLGEDGVGAVLRW